MNQSALILMTTYNGEEYLSQQIDSIINQTYQNWKLIIRDDGSSDSTIQMLSDYEKKDPRIIIHHNNTKSHGAYLNFWTLIHEARKRYFEFDYYFFSDQDDVWENYKLETMINQGNLLPQNKPVLIYGDMRVIDQNNKIIYESLNEVMGIGEMSGYSLFFTHGFLWGCDICVNNSLFISMPLLPLDHPHIEIMSHDNYMGKYALLTGEIKYIDRVMINHRRHGDNTTGNYLIKLSPLMVAKKIAFQFDDLAKTHARVYNQTLTEIIILEDKGNGNNKIIQEINQTLRRGGVKGVYSMYKMKVKRKQLQRSLGIYLIMLLKSYKKYIEV